MLPSKIINYQFHDEWDLYKLTNSQTKPVSCYACGQQPDLQVHHVTIEFVTPYNHLQ